MAVREVLIAPDPRLKIKSDEVTEITDEIKQLVNDMIETMYVEDGVGLAAAQIGVHKKVIVTDLEGDSVNRKPKVYLNAEIIENSEEISSHNEACLSLPNQAAEVKRPAKVTYKYRDLDWKEHIEEAVGLHATCIQHEIDHTNGIIYVDRISPMKKNIILEKLRKLKIKLGKK